MFYQDFYSRIMGIWIYNRSRNEKISSDISSLTQIKMEIIKKTNILVLTKKKIVVRQTPPAEPLLCRQCGVLLLTVQKAADLFEVGTRLIYRLIESESIHFIENETNEIYVCPASIKEILRKTR